MNQMEGLEYAKEHNLIEEKPREFYKLFKYVARMKGLTGNEKVILSIVLSYTNRGMEFTMSNKMLSIEAGMGEATVSRTITALKEKGWIKSFKVFSKITKNIIGRVIRPDKTFLIKEPEKSYTEYEYIEY